MERFWRTMTRGPGGIALVILAVLVGLGAGMLLARTTLQGSASPERLPVIEVPTNPEGPATSPATAGEPDDALAPPPEPSGGGAPPAATPAAPAAPRPPGDPGSDPTPAPPAPRPDPPAPAAPAAPAPPAPGPDDDDGDDDPDDTDDGAGETDTDD